MRFQIQGRIAELDGLGRQTIIGCHGKAPHTGETGLPKMPAAERMQSSFERDTWRRKKLAI